MKKFVFIGIIVVLILGGITFKFFGNSFKLKVDAVTSSYEYRSNKNYALINGTVSSGTLKVGDTAKVERDGDNVTSLKVYQLIINNNVSQKQVNSISKKDGKVEIVLSDEGIDTNSDKSNRDINVKNNDVIVK